MNIPEEAKVTDEEINNIRLNKAPDILHPDMQRCCEEVANFTQEKLLSTCYPCKECSWKDGYFVDSNGHICPSCKGTGQGSPMFAQLDPNQELPKLRPHAIVSDGMQTQRDMRNQGWRKTIP